MSRPCQPLDRGHFGHCFISGWVLTLHGEQGRFARLQNPPKRGAHYALLQLLVMSAVSVSNAHFLMESELNMLVCMTALVVPCAFVQLQRERERFNHMSIRPAWPMRTSPCSCLSQLKDGCQAIRNTLLVLVPHKGAHGTTTAVIQISILSSNSIQKTKYRTVSNRLRLNN